MTIDTIIGVDLAKNVFQIHGTTAEGPVLFRKKLSRPQFHRFMSDQPASKVVMEACGGEDLLPVWKSLCTQMLLSYSRLDDNEQIFQEHASILEAIRAGSKQKTIAAIKANIR